MILYKLSQHDQLYHLWCDLGIRNLSVAHVDFHCDMRGLLVDRERSLAWRIPEIRKTLDEGNYLRYAIFDGIVNAVTWIHDLPGGRLYDVHTVKYTTDLLARRYRRLQASQQALELPYREVLIKNWPGPEKGQWLDIDWDVFADGSLPLAEIYARVERFFDKALAIEPSGVSVCYSPYHSHDSRNAYDAFTERLAKLYDAQIKTLPYTPGSNEIPLKMKVIPTPIYNGLQRVYHAGRLQLKRWSFQ